VRLRDVHFTDKSRGVTRLGWVWHGRRDITICSMLPPRVSLRGYMYRERSADDFGAPARGQWPPWAVRRKLLYDTLLHELGHLQLHGDPWRGEPAHEVRAQEFANDWRGRLYSERFDHPDPVHNVPTDDEREAGSYWQSLDKEYRMRVTRIVVGEWSPGLMSLGALPAAADRFLRRLVRSGPVRRGEEAPAADPTRTR
jgi:hypothetical protein